MTRARPTLLASAAMALAGAGTTWFALTSWGVFVSDPARFMAPLFAIGLLLAVVGALARWSRLPGLVVVGLQLAVATAFLLGTYGGSVVPREETRAQLVETFRLAVETAQGYQAPVPPLLVPGVHPLLVLGGVVCLLAVDTLAGTLRRVPLAGLPLLMVYSLPVSMEGQGMGWVTFAITAGGFLLMLFLQEAESIDRWGRQLEGGRPETDDTVGVRSAAVRTSALSIGAGTTALAVLLPVFIPTADLDLFGQGPGAGGEGEITIVNPMADLRRDLVRGPDRVVITVQTDDPSPSYLRIGVLNRFSGNAWQSGDRAIPSEQTASGPMPPLEGVDGDVRRVERDYTIAISEAFESMWLPTPVPLAAIEAAGPWKYDLRTMDFLHGREDLSTAGLEYTATGLDLLLDAEDMAAAPNGAGEVDRMYTALPDDMPPLVGELAEQVTEGAPSDFEKAVLLQEWFRDEFDYDLTAVSGNGNDELVEFLTPGPGGRTGYCEQFAAAMAVMARDLGIPARVAVGFLRAEPVGADRYEFSTHDLHAWPEIYIPGSGWVRFEPTPGGRTGAAPSYTNRQLGAGPDQAGPSEAAASEDTSSAPADRPTRAEPSAAAGDAAADAGFPWRRVALLAGLAAALGGLLVLPRTARRRRRTRRLRDLTHPEPLWSELRDAVVDLGRPWPHGLSPRDTRARLVGWFGSPGDDTERPAHGEEVNPEAVAALDRLVSAVEVGRYAPDPPPLSEEAADGLRDDLDRCEAALTAGATPRARRRAAWAPGSVLRRRTGRRRPAPRGPGPPGSPARPLEAVDRVG